MESRKSDASNKSRPLSTTSGYCCLTSAYSPSDDRKSYGRAKSSVLMEDECFKGGASLECRTNTRCPRR